MSKGKRGSPHGSPRPTPRAGRYGGIQLGPDRFKHINNAARDTLVQFGLLGPGRPGTAAALAKGGKGGKRR